MEAEVEVGHQDHLSVGLAVLVEGAQKLAGRVIAEALAIHHQFLHRKETMVGLRLQMEQLKLEVVVAAGHRL
ncbi:MAG: hypothetical protein EBT73_05980 [Actinobacteria bacterium]|nr:hypothetical protein [Actinomycetota bacterium]